MVDAHVVRPAEEPLVDLVEPRDRVAGDDFGANVGARLALDELVGLLVCIGEVSNFS